MTFTTPFGQIVCAGDTIETARDGFTITARIVRDECDDAPDERQDGFWPSLYKDAPGFIGPGNKFRQRFADAQAKADAVMKAWKADEWFYCGIVLCVTRHRVMLDPHAASLWGVEANYPDTDNSYLLTVANELLPEALEQGRAVIARMCGAHSA